MNRERGFSLVELMVAITLALIVSAGVVSVFVGARRAFQSTSGIAALSDNGRFALTFLENAVRSSGYMSCGPSARTVSNLNPEATSLYYAPAANFFPPMTGFEAANTGVGSTYAAATTAGALTNWNPTLDGAFSSLSVASSGLPVKNNDILVTRSANLSSQPSYVTSIVDNAGTFTVDAQQALVAPQLAIISNCGKAMLFQITGISGAAPSVTVSHGAGGVPGNSVAAFPSSFGVGSLVAPLQTTVYFIGKGSDGDGALFAADMQPNNTLLPNELVPDIEAMQILYGVDTNGTQTVSQYVTADQVLDFGSAMSVQVALLAAGPPGSAVIPTVAHTYSLFGTLVTAPLDTRVRQVFQVTIAARNALP